MKTKPSRTIPEELDIRRPFSLVHAGVYLLAILLFCLNHWINRQFGKLDIDQIAYHLQFGAQGLEDSDPAIARQLQGSRPKNLVRIYVESIATGYSNGQVFGSKLIAPWATSRPAVSAPSCRFPAPAGPSPPSWPRSAPYRSSG